MKEIKRKKAGREFETGVRNKVGKKERWLEKNSCKDGYKEK